MSLAAEAQKPVIETESLLIEGPGMSIPADYVPGGRGGTWHGLRVWASSGEENAQGESYRLQV